MNTRIRKECDSMKIEKISDTQIRCTLNKEDLINRELRISELAYGSEKAKQLFKDMMQQAACEFGFEADDIPLMIEATPVSADCLVLVITKVEDPDELDTRFSNFTPYAQQSDNESSEDIDTDTESTYADEILNCFEHLGELLGKRDKTTSSDSSQKADNKTQANSKKQKTVDIQIPSNLTKVFTFSSLSDLIKLSKIIQPYYEGNNKCFKNPINQKYYLILQISDHSPEEFNKVCNIVSEYGQVERINYASISYYEEHFEVILPNDAIQHLANL